MPTHLLLTEAITESQKLESLLKRHLYGIDMNGGARTILSHAALDVAMGHFIAIRSLAATRQDTDSTVRALFRPLLESCYRSGWLAFLASDAELEAIQTDPSGKHFPGLKMIAKGLDNRDGSNFFEFTLKDIVLAHDFTHCGIQALRRHYQEEWGIGPVHDPQELATLVHRSIVILAWTSLLFTDAAEMKQASLEIALAMGKRIEA